MNKMAIQPDGTVVTYEEAFKNKTWEGGVKLDDPKKKTEDFLSRQDLAKVAAFVNANKKYYDCKDPERSAGRRNMLYEKAKAEMIALNKEDARRQKEGLPMLTAEERKLIMFEGGVVRSSWRNEEINRAAREEFDTYRDAKRGNQDR